MTPVRALVVDDEPWARERILDLLSADAEVEVVGECRGGREAVAALREGGVDLVLLDVQMPDLDGFAVIEEIGTDAMPAVIFVTAHDQHAVRAFEVHAFDYLLKPFDRERFREAVTRAVRVLREVPAGRSAGRLQELLSQVRETAEAPLDRVLVRSAGRLALLRVDRIDWIEAEGNYVRLHVGPTSHLLRQTMAALDRQLDPARFLRIHRSTIVNLDRVKEIQPLFGGECAVVLDDGTELGLSKSYRSRLERFTARRG